ncbi:unnamed protein product [Rotaria sp. Silwood1]|nr:unnamed protein product [Rotaria sp. Silwood1]
MASPILSKAWFNNTITGLPYTGIFKNYTKSKSKMIRLNNALDYLVNNGLIECGTANKKHLVGARRETYMKTPPFNIRTDKNKLTALELININIDEYEHIYMNSPLPANIQLTEETIKLILSNEEYTPIVHLFNDIRVEQEMELRIASHIVQQEIIQGKKQYHIVSSSQRVDNDNSYVQNIFEFDFDSLSNNNNNSSISDVPVHSIHNLSSLSSSSCHINESHLFSSLYRSNLTTASSTEADLQYQNNQDTMSFEHELYEIEQELLQASRYSSNVIDKNVINNMSNEIILVTQVRDPVNTPVILNNELYEPVCNATDVEKQRKVQNKITPKITTCRHIVVGSISAIPLIPPIPLTPPIPPTPLIPTIPATPAISPTPPIPLYLYNPYTSIPPIPLIPAMPAIPAIPAIRPIPLYLSTFYP